MKKSKMPSIVSVLILTLITVVFWVTFDVYRLFNQADVPVVTESVSRPLTPSLDQNAINQIESRIFIDNSQIPDDVVISNNDIIVTPDTTPDATPVPDSPSPNPVDATTEEQ